MGTGKFRQLVPSPESRSFVLTFSHPDYTVGSGLAPDPPRPFARPRVAGSPFHRHGITAGPESTPKRLTRPARAANTGLPVGATMSMPVCISRVPKMGCWRNPKPEVTRPRAGQRNPRAMLIAELRLRDKAIRRGMSVAPPGIVSRWPGRIRSPVDNPLDSTRRSTETPYVWAISHRV